MRHVLFLEGNGEMRGLTRDSSSILPHHVYRPILYTSHEWGESRANYMQGYIYHDTSSLLPNR